eukprot:219616-Chlamydomonas_euryale.AAC.1
MGPRRPAARVWSESQQALAAAPICCRCARDCGPHTRVGARCGFWCFGWEEVGGKRVEKEGEGEVWVQVFWPEIECGERG